MAERSSLTNPTSTRTVPAAGRLDDPRELAELRERIEKTVAPTLVVANAPAEAAARHDRWCLSPRQEAPCLRSS